MPACRTRDRKSTRLNSSHVAISYAVFCLKKKKKTAATSQRKLQPRSSNREERPQFGRWYEAGSRRLFRAALRPRRLVTAPALFFFNDTATTEIYTLSLHDALPIARQHALDVRDPAVVDLEPQRLVARSEEHTSELQSRGHLVCRLLLEKKKQP